MPARANRPLSGPMIRVLRNLRNGKRASHHCTKQADYGGLQGTLRALIKLGLLDWDHNLTPKGAAVAKDIP